jgi:hypothetical protein
MTRFQTRHSRTSGSNCVSASTRGAGEADDNSASEGLPEDEEEEHRADEEELEDAFREIDVLAEDIRTKRSAYGGPTANHRGTGGDGRVVENDLQKKLSLRTSEAVMAMSSLPGAFDSNGQPLPKPSQQRLINMARDQKEERNHRHNRERYGPNIEPATEQLPIDDLQLRMNTFISLANKEAFEAQQEYQSRQKRRRRRRLLLLVSGIVLVSIVAVVVGIMLGTGGSSTSDNNTGEDGKNDSESLVSERCIASGNESQESNRYQEIRSTLISMNPAMEMSLSVANSTARKSLCWLAYADALEELERGKQYQMLQRFTLVIIYFHFAGREEIQGNSLSQSKWLTSVPVCQWDFLVCDEGGEPDVVTGMLLGGTKLNGRIASEISNLSKLTDLQLTSNALTGEIPKELWTMTRLESLTLAYSQLSGTVSNELAQLVELRYLSLGSRSFNGTFPDIGAMTNLKTLLVSESFDIVGPLPNISGLTNLGEAINMQYAFRLCFCIVTNNYTSEQNSLNL